MDSIRHELTEDLGSDVLAPEQAYHHNSQMAPELQNNSLMSSTQRGGPMTTRVRNDGSLITGKTTFEGENSNFMNSLMEKKTAD